MEREYTYYVTVKDKLTGQTLMNSEKMNIDFLMEHFIKICVQLYFEMDMDYTIEQIEFDIMRIEPEKKVDIDLLNYLDNSILSLVNGLEKKHGYKDAQMIILYSAFAQINLMFGKFILVNQCHNERKINAVYNKVINQLQSLTFLQIEEIILLVEWFNAICEKMLNISIENEKFEISANIKKYLSAKNIYPKQN